jgi:polyhydroxybutyrate depolymerase
LVFLAKAIVKITLLIVVVVCALLATGMLVKFLVGRAKSSKSSSESLMTSSGDYVRSMEVDGRERTYRLHVPVAIPPKNQAHPAPLLIAFHGRLGQGRAMEKMSKFDSLSDEHGFIVAYPDGVGRSWNAGHGAGSAERKNVDDVGFVAKLIDEVSKEFQIDGHRVFAVGISNGGIFVHRLGCQLSDRIAAIATVAGTMPRGLAGQCHPVKPLSVLIIHGTADRFSPWEGGSTKGGGRVESVETTVTFWAIAGRCKPTPQITDLGNGVLRESYEPCEGGHNVVLYRVGGAGHSWPGGENLLPARVIGEVNQSWNASLAIWEFFQTSLAEQYP